MLTGFQKGLSLALGLSHLVEYLGSVLGLTGRKKKIGSFRKLPQLHEDIRGGFDLPGLRKSINRLLFLTSVGIYSGSALPLSYTSKQFGCLEMLPLC